MVQLVSADAPGYGGGMLGLFHTAPSPQFFSGPQRQL
jgi:hypothetical protein